MLKRFFPHSLFGRFLLMILLPMILVQFIAAYAFYERHWNSVTRHMSASLVGDVALLSEIIQDRPLSERGILLQIAAHTLYLNTYFIPEKTLAAIKPRGAERIDDLDEQLSAATKRPFAVYHTKRDNLVIFLELNDGVLKIVAPIKRISNPTTYIFILWLTGASFILALVSILFMRNQVRSITKLANAAERFGKGQVVNDFKPTGAAEVRQASQAFLDMKERIQKQVSQRMEMLSGISHDLKTPITRIKLHLSMMKQTNDIKALQEDMEQMEHMVQEYLDFARGSEKAEFKPVNISDMLRSLASAYHKQKKSVEVKAQSGLVLPLNHQAIRRAFTNIIDNGLRYGKAVSVESAQVGNTIRIIFDDNGPGIPLSKREVVFKPFYRIESSRNSDTGGVGLGLSITKDAITQHGGSITLDESPMGGLRVIVTLPV